MLLMSKGSKVVFVAYVHNTDTFNTMSKGSKEALKVLIVTGRECLIRTWLIRSSTYFEVSLKSLPDSYHFMFKING